MKLLAIGDEARVRKYLPDLPITRDVELVVAARGSSDEELLALAPDADFIMADAISPVSRTLIESMANLKLIHSEGVAYNAIDVSAARERGIYVCNNPGANAGAVAEQAIMLMLMCLRDALAGDAAVRAGMQIRKKERMMVEGYRELGDCTVGLVGFGSIGRATAERLANWGCAVKYYRRHRLSETEEDALGVSYAGLDEIASTCDIVSLHVPVTPETREMVDEGFLGRMKPDAILINTARGEIVDQFALAKALEQGVIGGAGLDTLSPEPVQIDHPLLNMSPQASAKLVLSPHIGGVSEGMFVRAHRNIWENVARVSRGEAPVAQV